MPRFSSPAWSVWEDDVAYEIGGAKVPASGRFSLFKGDAKTNKVMVDCKHTESSGYAVTVDFWKKLLSWAINESREPVIAIRIDSKDGVRSEIAVVHELFYNEVAETWFDTVGMKATKRKQKTVTAKQNKVEPTLFMLGSFRLVAYSFESFVDDIKRYESEVS